MLKPSKSVFLFLIVLSLSTVLACSNSSPAGPGGKTTSATVSVDVQVPSQAQSQASQNLLGTITDITSLAVDVLKEGVPLITGQPLTYSAGVWSGTLHNLPIGPSLTFVGHAYNASAVEIFTGTTVQLDKPLTAESYLSSTCVALIGQVVEPDADLLQEFRRTFPDVLAETAGSSVFPALLLSNHAALNQLLHAQANGTLSALAALPDDESRVQHAFEITLGRPPDEEEKQVAIAYVRQRDYRQAALSQLLWAMIASAEFRLNH